MKISTLMKVQHKLLCNRIVYLHCMTEVNLTLELELNELGCTLFSYLGFSREV